MVWLVWIGKEGLCLLGAFPWGGGVRLLTKGGSFFEDPFFVERTEGGRFRGGIFGGGKWLGGGFAKKRM
jgi:hypothetical protein